LAAAVPVTAFSASSWAAVPCAGPENAGGVFPAVDVGELDDVVEEVDAALAIAPPPSTAAPTLAPATSMDLMFLMSLLEVV
jgi:hypothetical protein